MRVKYDTVLVIEDDEILAKFVKKLLTYQGYNVVLAYNGRTGLVAVRQHEPQLILLDLGLPVLDGEAFLVVYSSQTQIHAPVIVMTGRTDNILPMPHVVKVLQKPFEAQTLMAVVDKWVAFSQFQHS